jgi:hypothetical protein
MRPTAAFGGQAAFATDSMSGHPRALAPPPAGPDARSVAAACGNCRLMSVPAKGSGSVWFQLATELGAKGIPQNPMAASTSRTISRGKKPLDWGRWHYDLLSAPLDDHA